MEDALDVAVAISKICSRQDLDDLQAIESALQTMSGFVAPLWLTQKVTLEQFVRPAEEQFAYEQRFYHRNFD